MFQALRNDLSQYAQHLRLHPCVFTTIWLGLSAIRNATPYPEILHDVHLPLRTPILQQSHLGWEQLYHGRLSKEWAEAINTIHLQLAKTGEQVLIHIQKLIWKYVLSLWSLRNQHLHQQATTLNLPDYRQAVITLYDQRHRLSPAAQAALYRYSLQEVLDLPPPRMEQWLIRGYKYYHRQLKAAKHQAALNTPDIRDYFGIQTQESDDLHPP